jgi:hypothetical protein
LASAVLLSGAGAATGVWLVAGVWLAAGVVLLGSEAPLVGVPGCWARAIDEEVVSRRAKVRVRMAGDSRGEPVAGPYRHSSRM